VCDENGWWECDCGRECRDKGTPGCRAYYVPGQDGARVPADTFHDGGTDQAGTLRGEAARVGESRGEADMRVLEIVTVTKVLEIVTEVKTSLEAMNSLKASGTCTFRVDNGLLEMRMLWFGEAVAYYVPLTIVEPLAAMAHHHIAEAVAKEGADGH
jgi:hypothetical protein